MATAILGYNYKKRLKVEVVPSLPDIGKTGMIYFVPNDEEGTNRYDEYLWVKDLDNPNGIWERVGSKEIDLTQYFTKEEITQLLSQKVDTTTYETFVNSISALNTQVSNHINDKGNPHQVTKAQIGLESVDNTSDLDKPISTATQNALNNKVNVEPGKGLSTNDYTSKDKEKLASLENTSIATKEVAGKVKIGEGLQVTADGVLSTAPYESSIKDLCYGVEWDSTVSTSNLTRIGNTELHRTLPIQSAMRGCVVKGKAVQYYLDPKSWYLKKNNNKVFENAGVAYNSDTKTLTFNYTDVPYDDTTNSKRTWYTPGQYVKVESLTDNKYVVFKTLPDPAVHLPDDVIMVLKVDEIVDGTLTIPTTDSTKYKVTFGSNLSGYDGEVMVEVPEFYIWSEVDGTKRRVWISQYKINPYAQRTSHCFVSAYKVTLMGQVPKNMGYLSTLPANSAVSIVNSSTYCRGNNNDSNKDQWRAYNPILSCLGKPRTAVNRAYMRSCMRNAGSETMNYIQYKNIMYWLYVIEYANFNSQEAVNNTLTTEGYHQGGLGMGFSQVNYYEEGMHIHGGNACNCYIPCGFTNSLGNGTGEVMVEPFEYTKPGIQTWINGWNVSNAIATRDNDNHKIIITNITNNTYAYGIVWNRAFYGQGTYHYNITGIPEGGTITCKSYPDNTVLATITEDGDYEIPWPNNNMVRGFYVDFTGEVNIVITQTDEALGDDISYTDRFPNTDVFPNKAAHCVNRWRGIEQPFGDIWQILDGIICKRNVINGECYIYVTDNPEDYGDDKAAMSKMTIAGTGPMLSGYIKDFNLGETAEIIPSTSGLSPTQYMYDGVFQSGSVNLTMLFVGGSCYAGAAAGLAFWGSDHGVAGSVAYYGFRSIKVLS